MNKEIKRTEGAGCSGPLGCENKEYNDNDPQCTGECMENYQKAMEDSIAKLVTIDQVVEYIISNIHPTDLNYIKTMKKDELIILHHTLGRHIRNTFELWGEKGQWIIKETCNCDNKVIADRLSNIGIEISLEHADEASMILIEKIWEKLGGVKNTDNRNKK